MIADKIVEILKEIGEDPTRDGLKETPKRVEKAYKELFGGYNVDLDGIVKEFESDGYDQMVIVKNINYYSHCEHHMVPFYGTVSIGYIPDKKIVGLSKFGRIVEAFSKRLQVQERMTKQIADFIQEKLKPKGLIVVVKGKHMCMMMRGVKKETSETITSDVRGVIRENINAKNEFLSLID